MITAEEAKTIMESKIDFNELMSYIDNRIIFAALSDEDISYIKLIIPKMYVPDSFDNGAMYDFLMMLHDKYHYSIELVEEIDEDVRLIPNAFNLIRINKQLAMIDVSHTTHYYPVVVVKISWDDPENPKIFDNRRK